MKWKVMLTTATAAASTGLLLAACSQGQSKSDNAGELTRGNGTKASLELVRKWLRTNDFGYFASHRFDQCQYDQ